MIFTRATSDQWLRHYRFQEQLQTPKRYIAGIELLQYSIMNARRGMDKREQQDWITFIGHATHITGAAVARTKHIPAV